MSKSYSGPGLPSQSYSERGIVADVTGSIQVNELFRAFSKALQRYCLLGRPESYSSTISQSQSATSRYGFSTTESISDVESGFLNTVCCERSVEGVFARV